MVAAGRARATRTALIDDPFAEPLVRAVGVDFFTRWAAGELDSADVDVPGAPWGMQRMTDMLAARTRYIDAFFAARTDAGIRQVVILAAGLDARGYRLPWAPGTTVFEIDQPQVIEFKTATIAALGAEPTADVRAVADRPAPRLAVGVARGRVRLRATRRVGRRGPARVPAAGGPGPVAGQHHRAQRRRQPTGGRGLSEFGQPTGRR